MPEDRLVGAHRLIRATGRRSARSSSASRRGAARARLRPASDRSSSSSAQRRLGPLDHGDDLGAVGERRDRLDQGRAGAAPGDDLAVGEADRVAAAKAAVGVVACGRGDGADPDRREPGARAARRSRPRHRAGSNSTSAASPACWELGWHDDDRARRCRRQPRRLLGRHRTFGEFGRTTTSSAGRRLDPGEQVLGRRVQRRAAVDDERAEPPRTAPAAPRRWRPRRPRTRRARAAPAGSATCSCMSAMSSSADVAGAGEQRLRGVGVVGVDVDLERRLVADDEDRVADRLEPADEGVALEPLAGDDEVGAVAVRASRRGGPGRAAPPRSGGSRAAGPPRPRARRPSRG